MKDCPDCSHDWKDHGWDGCCVPDCFCTEPDTPRPVLWDGFVRWLGGADLDELALAEATARATRDRLLIRLAVAEGREEVPRG